MVSERKVLAGDEDLLGIAYDDDHVDMSLVLTVVR